MFKGISTILGYYQRKHMKTVHLGISVQKYSKQPFPIGAFTERREKQPNYT